MNVEMNLRTHGYPSSTPVWALSDKCIASMVDQLQSKVQEGRTPLTLNYTSKEVGEVVGATMMLPEPYVQLSLSDSLDPTKLVLGPAFQVERGEHFGDFFLVFGMTLHGVSVFPEAEDET